MALILADRVFETTVTTGTGTLTLAGAQLGYRSFLAGIGVNNTTFYSVANAGLTEWEIGLGTLDATGALLSRTTVYSSSNAGALVNFSTGTKSVFCDIPASKVLYSDAAGNTGPTLTNSVLTTPTLNGGTINSTNLNSMVNLLLVGL